MTKYCFVGLDIGRYENYAFIMDSKRNKIKEFPFMQTHVGYEKLIYEIHALEKQGFTPIVTAEGHSGNMSPLDEYLLSEGIIVKPVHPTAVNRHKDVLGQPKKTDSYDAYVIADLLFFQHEKISPLPSEEQIEEIKSLSRAYKNLTKTKTRLSNQLQQEIMSYFPELLNDESEDEKVFSKITCKTALNLLAEYPTPQSLSQIELSELTSFLEKVSRGHLGEERAKEILKRASSVEREPSYIESKALIVSTLARQILSLDEDMKKIKQQLEKLSEESLALQRIQSMDGAGTLYQQS